MSLGKILRLHAGNWLVDKRFNPLLLFGRRAILANALIKETTLCIKRKKLHSKNIARKLVRKLSIPDTDRQKDPD